MAKFKEKMPPSKKIMSPTGKKVKGRKYSEVKEVYDRKMGEKDNFPAKKPADISEALMRARQGYSNKPRVKMSKTKGK